MNAKHAESNFAYEHPALVATVVTIAIALSFLGALYASAGGGHHDAGAHGAAGSASAAAPGSAKPAATGAKPATSAK
ncbi:MAG: hypothetical protein IPM79_14295 [Polyangiaceae bacterium]|jgi:hypothetical protein|nr:hypothetical protein [Polyangiaceae bacterium]MBK8938759.1 hypothetical protein [Polyangiaceae bacterium]